MKTIDKIKRLAAVVDHTLPPDEMALALHASINLNLELLQEHNLPKLTDEYKKTIENVKLRLNEVKDGRDGLRGEKGEKGDPFDYGELHSLLLEVLEDGD